MQLSDFNYELPARLIAQNPLAERTASRLLEVQAGSLVDRQFKEILSLLKPGDLLIMNDTKVIPARLHGKKPTGGAIELLIERITSNQRAWVQIRASKVPKLDSIVQIHNRNGQSFEAKVVAYDGRFFEIEFPEAILDLL